MAGRASFGQVTKMRSGRYQARYAVPGSNPPKYVKAPATFDRKKEAADWLARERTRINDNLLHPAESGGHIKFADYAEEWLETRRNSKGEGLRPSTRRSYQYYLELHVLPRFGAAPLNTITRAAVKAWYADLCPNAPTVRAKTYSMLRTILNTAVDDDGLIRENPCRIRGASVTPAATKTVIATPDQVDELAAHLPERLALSALLGAWCQVRNGELLELRRGDVGEGGATLSITRGVTYAGKGQMVVGPPKTDAGVRLLSVPPHVREALLDHVERFANPGVDGLLFPAKPGVDVHYMQTTYSYLFKQAVRASTLPDTFRFHWLRHTGLTLAAQAGATVAELKNRAGHSTASTVMRYQHATGERDQRLAEALSVLAGASKPGLQVLPGGAGEREEAVAQSA